MNLNESAVFSLLSFALSRHCALLCRALACASAALLLSLFALFHLMPALYRAAHVYDEVAAVHKEVFQAAEEACRELFEAAALLLFGFLLCGRVALDRLGAFFFLADNVVFLRVGYVAAVEHAHALARRFVKEVAAVLEFIRLGVLADEHLVVHVFLKLVRLPVVRRPGLLRFFGFFFLFFLFFLFLRFFLDRLAGFFGFFLRFLNRFVDGFGFNARRSCGFYRLCGFLYFLRRFNFFNFFSFFRFFRFNVPGRVRLRGLYRLLSLVGYFVAERLGSVGTASVTGSCSGSGCGTSSILS